MNEYNVNDYKGLARQILDDEFGIDVYDMNDYQLDTIIKLLQLEQEERREEHNAKKKKD